jgi:hypothetical protein
MTRGNICTFDVFLFELNTKCVDTLEGSDCIFETVIYHSDKRHLIIKNVSNSLESCLSLVRRLASIEVSPQIAVEFVIPEIRNADPIPIIAGCSIRKAKLILSGIKDNINVLIPAHRPRQRYHSLLTVDEPVHHRGACCVIVLESLPLFVG